MTAISPGGGVYVGHTCAVLADGTVRCWGDDSKGQLGDGTEPASTIPVEVAGITTAKAVATGAQFSCALLGDGTVRCWGSNDAGQLGDGPGADGGPTPVPVTGITDATAIAAGWSHACVLSGDGKVQCWGDNDYGELGDGTTDDSPAPVVVSGITSATAIAAGPYATCAVLREGGVRCWGQNDHGQLGNGITVDSSIPVAVSGIATATSVAVGYGHACALLEDDTVRCWGDDYWGQLGDGIDLGSPTDVRLAPVDRLAPVAVTGLASATSIAAGSNHACAVLADGTVRCWGNGNYGELGDGTGDGSSVPVQARGVTTATGVAAGGDMAGAHTCALLRDGTVTCWGMNGSGQLGDGTTIGRSAPVPVVAAPLPTPTFSSDTSAWTRVDSPSLGYSIALPGDRWQFSGHVDRTESQKPYDMFVGTVSPSGGDMMLMIACDRLEAGATPPPITADVVADGVPIAVIMSPLSETGPTTFVAGGVKGDRICSVMADTSNTEASQSFFRLVLTTFRFPAQDFVEPSPGPSPS